ncbi:MAG: dihydroxy-acid dehydratase [Deltaproteobacteria bacterium RBG_13_52_11]|nr:MAG: dihydroxy-acid dehydratase [Deltaproteobacteria bacterium RBG_13_52_11]
MKSTESLCGLENADIRNVLKAMGYSDDDLTTKRPAIGIANSWNTFIPGHFNFNQISEQVKKGIHRAGGTVYEFGVIGLCDAVAKENFNYVLPSREVICDSVEIMAGANPLDGIILLASCDKIVPGMLMAAARLDIPAILVNSGPMLGGVAFGDRKSDATSASEALGMYKTGKISLEAYKIVEDLSCPTCGSCSFMGTANTMCCLTEAMGMSLTDGAAIPAVYADRLRLAEQSGEAICHLVKQGITARDIINKKSLENAVKVCLAIGGSTNAVLHLCALAYEAETDINIMNMFDALSKKTPTIAKVYPAAHWDMEDLWKAGGIPRIIDRLRPILHMDVMTCTGKTMEENIDAYQYRFPENNEVIKTMDAPFAPSGGLVVLRGNLAPQTGISKPIAIDPSVRQFTGTAVVFDSEEEANQAILDGKIKAGNVVVIRYEGPKGGPGMVEMYRALKYLYGMGLNTSTAVVTDGRFSGTNNGCFVGHISPEAAEGGPLAIVENGDKISIDVINGTIHLHLSDTEIERRLQHWQKPEPKVKKGYLSLYSRLASSADEGAIIKHRLWPM